MQEIHFRNNSPRSQRINLIYQENKKMLKKSNRLIFWQYISILLLILSFTCLLLYVFIFYPTESSFSFKNQLTNINITFEELYNMSFHYLNLTKDSNIIINDNKYLLPDLGLIKSFLDFDKTNNMIYKTDFNDCDDFSFILFGNFLKEQYKTLKKNHSFSLGIAYGKSKDNYLNHAFNIFLDSNYKFYCIETQSDEIMLCNDYKYRIYQIIF